MSENKKKLKMSEDENLDKNDDFTELDSGYGNINTKVDEKPKFYINTSWTMPTQARVVRTRRIMLALCCLIQEGWAQIC